MDRYEQYLRTQVGELITQYGPLLILWFDVSQDFDAKRGQGVVDYVRSLQPGIIINNRCAVAGDYETPEQQVGSFNRERPWETCMTIAQQWAWKPRDETKSRIECLHTLLRITHMFPSITARQLRLNILDASEGPTITEFQVF